MAVGPAIFAHRLGASGLGFMIELVHSIAVRYVRATVSALVHLPKLALPVNELLLYTLGAYFFCEFSVVRTVVVMVTLMLDGHVILIPVAVADVALGLQHDLLWSVTLTHEVAILKSRVLGLSWCKAILLGIAIFWVYARRYYN